MFGPIQKEYGKFEKLLINELQAHGFGITERRSGEITFMRKNEVVNYSKSIEGFVLHYKGDEEIRITGYVSTTNVFLKDTNCSLPIQGGVAEMLDILSVVGAKYKVK